MNELTPAAREHLEYAQKTLLLIVAMNRATRRQAGWTRPKHHYLAQLHRVLRDLGESE